MQDLAILLRAMQLVAHNGHNLVTGQSFFEDHEHFAALYADYEKTYDDVVEKCIGLGLPIDLQEVTQEAAMKASAFSTADLSNPAKGFGHILKMENELIALVEKLDDGASYGTKNLLQGIADLAENRCYQLKQRMK
jgi:DNA-binding ferritin-like protein